jgi:predicted RNase H-like nuclease (RuvC/YqgF family)
MTQLQSTERKLFELEKESREDRVANIKFKSAINHMRDSLIEFSKKYPDKTSAINARQSIINKLIDYYNAAESYINTLERESNECYELKKVNESYENMLCFWHNDVIIKGRKYNLDLQTYEEIMENVRANKPS